MLNAGLDSLFSSTGLLNDNFDVGFRRRQARVLLPSRHDRKNLILASKQASKPHAEADQLRVETRNAGASPVLSSDVSPLQRMWSCFESHETLLTAEVPTLGSSDAASVGMCKPHSDGSRSHEQGSVPVQGRRDKQKRDQAKGPEL